MINKKYYPLLLGVFILVPIILAYQTFERNLEQTSQVQPLVENFECADDDCITDGRMTCSIESEVLLVMKDGIGTQYKGRSNDKFEIGDTIDISYGYREDELIVRLGRKQSGDVMFIASFFPVKEMSIYDESSAYGSNKTYNRSGYHHFSLSKYLMKFSKWDGHQQLILSKTKNDTWDGMYTEVDHKNTFVVALDCTHQKPRNKNIIEYLYKQSLEATQSP